MDTLLGKIRLAAGLGKDSSLNIPTDLAGLTEEFRPGKKWFGNLLQREGEITDYDAVAGFDQYIETAADVITLTESIQKLRALEDQVRYRLSDEGIRAEIDKIRENNSIDALEKRKAIEKLYDDNRSTVEKMIAELKNQKQMGMGRFVTELRRYTNDLAGKKSKDDRLWEDFFSRQFYAVAKNMESRVAANMTAFNPAVWLTNFIPLTQATGEVSTQNLLRGMMETVKAAGKDDGYVDASTFLTNRYGSERLDRTATQRAGDLAGKPMELIDHFTAQSIHRGKYNQNIQKGMSVMEAMDDADAFTASLMADRSKGALPTIFVSKNPISKIFTMFQVEVNNQLSYLFKDMPQAKRQQGVMSIAAAYTKVFVGAELFNAAYRMIMGRNAALGPIGIIAEALGLWDDEEEKERTAAERIWKAAEEIGGQIPFVGGIVFGGGRIPLSAAIPDVGKIAQAAVPSAYGIEWSAEKRLQTAGKELAKPAVYLLPPFGGGALKKGAEGYATVKAGGSYTYDNDGRPKLQFPVYGENPWNYVQNMAFGKWSSKEAQKYIDSGFRGLSADETAVYNALRDEMGVRPQDAMEAVESLRGFETVKDAEGKTVQTVKEQQRLALLENSKLTAAQKAAIDRALIVTGEDEQPADYSNRTGFILSQYIRDGRKEAARQALDAKMPVEQFVYWDDRLSELSGEKGDDDKAVRTEAEARGMVLKDVMQSNFSAEEKQAIAEYVLVSAMGEKDREEWDTMIKGKVDASDFVKFKSDVSAYKDQAEGTGTDNMKNVAEMLRGYANLTDEQRDYLFQTFNSTMSNNPFHVSAYEKEIDKNSAFYQNLTEDGKEMVRSLLNQYEQEIQEGKELDEWRAKAYMANQEAGISPGTYAMYRVALKAADTNDNGISTDEAAAAVRAIDGLTQWQKAYLWQSTNKNWKKNPFGYAAVGQYESGMEEGIFPIAGGNIVAGFGPQNSGENWEMNRSIHVEAPEGTPVSAYKSGKIIKNEWSSKDGWTVEILHGDGTVSSYSHLMQQSGLQVGSEIGQGDAVGAAGKSGQVQNSGIDFSVRKKDDEGEEREIDPASVIPELNETQTGYVFRGLPIFSSAGESSTSAGTSTKRTSLPKLPVLPKFGR